MSLTLTNPTLSNPANKTEVEDNFGDITDKFAGNIINADISASAAIDTSKLAYRDFEFVVNLTTTSATEIFSVTTPSAVVGLPGLSTDGTYTVLSGNWICKDVGDQTTDFTLTFGRWSSGTVWTVDTTIATVTNMAGMTPAANEFGQGIITISGATLTLHASLPSFIGINFPNAAGAGFHSAATDFLSVTLKLRRTNGLR